MKGTANTSVKFESSYTCSLSEDVAYKLQIADTKLPPALDLKLFPQIDSKKGTFDATQKILDEIVRQRKET
ncbi:hypothetical protein U1Q18_051401, partial [Sarracenia purpurea var. burkii]